jgi:hypothetical protein
VVLRRCVCFGFGIIRMTLALVCMEAGYRGSEISGTNRRTCPRG